MCGISGVICRDETDLDEDELKKMNQLISHRGPDGDGFYVHRNVGFAHRRLAIIDLSSDGLQPMHYRDDLVITYNGEIYNYIEIREELKLLGYQFKSKSDTEVILAAYDKWGEDCVNHFNGMWAFAIYDKNKEVVFCSRDRFGIKPFYYRSDGKKFKFGSEIKQLLDDSNYAHTDLIAHYLLSGMHEHENRTFFEGILKLPPSHNLTYNLNSNQIELKRYYELLPVKNDTDYKRRLEDAIKLRLRSDVKVGTCLSGGLDSSTISAFASKLYHNESGEKFNAIHAKSIEKDTDESKWAEDVSSAANLNLFITEPSSDEFKSIFDEVIYTQEEPFGSPSIFLQYFVMKKASEIGCKVMLDGQGGDETLLGYERYYAPFFATLLRQRGVKVTLKEVLSSRKNNSKMSFKNIVKYVAGTFLINLRVFYLKTKLPIKQSYLPHSFPYFAKIRSNAFNLFQLQKIELLETNLQALLRYEDKNSMRHGIETRLPFLDYKTVETALSLPVERKIFKGWTKFVLREICATVLPERVAWRKNKLGFNAPDQSWLLPMKEELLLEIKCSKILKKILKNQDFNQFPVSGSWNLTWRLINLATWERVMKVKIR